MAHPKAGPDKALAMTPWRETEERQEEASTMIEQRWCTTDGTSWTLSHGKYWAKIELSLDITYFARIGSLKCRPEELPLKELNQVCWNGEFFCLKKAKAACLQHITDVIDDLTKSLQVSPYEGIFDRENYDDQS